MGDTQGATQHFRSVHTTLDHGRRFGFGFAHNNRVPGTDGGRDRRCAGFVIAGAASRVQSCGEEGSVASGPGVGAGGRNTVRCSTSQLSSWLATRFTNRRFSVV